MPNTILKSKRFLPLMITQFLGALNDNLFKNALLLMVTLKMASKAAVLSNIIAALFILPFFLFSATAGEIADKYDKSKIAKILKTTELLLMLGACAVYEAHSLWGLVILLGCMGTQSAFFGPIKYALLPQHLHQDELALGNAYVEAGTYMAILLGLILGTILPIGAVLVLLVLFSLCGLISSIFIPKAPSVREDAPIHKNIFKATSNTLKVIYQNKTVFRSIIGATWFWMIGAFVVVQIYPLSGNVLNVSNTVITFFLVLFSVGVAIGSVFCGHLMKGFIHATYTPLSVFAMGVCFYLLYHYTNHYPTPDAPVALADFFKTPHSLSISLTIFIMAFFGGFYIVPLNTLMQKTASKAYLASVIGGNNILNALGMALISLVTILLLAIGFTISELFLAVALLSIVVFFQICKLLPNAFWRSLLRAVFELFFKVKVEGSQNVIKAGKNVLIIANHTSLLDGLLIAAFMPEDVSFAINTEWSKKWFMKLFSLFVDFEPLNPTNPMSMRTLINKVKSGQKVMIFPEGRITITGGLMKIYEGAGMIAYKTNARIVPLRINGAQFSKFSYLKNKLRTKWFPKIELTFLKPERLSAPENMSRREQRHFISLKLYDLMTTMLYQTSNIDEHLFCSLLKATKQYGKNFKIAEDTNRKALSYKSFVQKSYVLGQAYQNAFLKETYIGLMLPNALVNAVSFFALQSVDKVPVMLNFSLGQTPFLSCVKTLKLQTVITAHEFIEKGRLEHLENALKESKVNLIYLEDFAKTIDFKTKFEGIKKYILRSKPKNSADRTAVVLFTSGSEGLPKAVCLSHKNLNANRAQFLSVLGVNSTDVLFNALPMFHSFGLTVGTLAPLLSGVKAFFYPSPLHYRIVPELIYDVNATIVCGTDTFFYGYGRLGHPYDFFNIKYAIVGGEKLKTRTAEIWMKKFGVRILEGYGTTETAPVLALNTPMYLKEGTVGRFLPHIEYKLEKVEGIDEGGRLFVKGDNVMKGYILPSNPTVLVENKGFYDTGDIASIDADGFVSIKGRIKRFAKIGGEMVSISAVESAVEKLYEGFISGIVPTEDEKKGEQLVLITNNEKAEISEIKAFFKTQGLSELCVPKRIVYLKNPPLLASGKFDYQSALKILENQ